MAKEPSPSFRVLMVVGGSYVSGAEIVALDLMRGLQTRGHEVGCVLSGWNDGELVRRLQALGVPYKPIKVGVLSKRLEWKYLKWTLDALVHLPKGWYDFWSFRRAFDPDVVVHHGIRQASMLRPLIRSSETVHYVHGVPDDSIHQRWIIDGAEHSGRAFIGVSSYVRDRLVKQGVPREKAVTIHNGVEAVPEDKLPPSSAGTRPTIGIVGQVGEWKGHEDLIDALRILREQGHEMRCLVIGEGDEAYERTLRQRAARCGVEDRIEWRGFVDETNDIYRDIDICVVPSRFQEPFGLVAAEAGVRRIPVVATRRGGLPEIVVDGETGYLVESENPSELADRLGRLLDAPEKRRSMGRQAREHVLQHFTRQRMVDECEQIFRQVANGGDR